MSNSSIKEKDKSEKKYCLILCTVNDKNLAKEISIKLIKARLAACITCIPNITSFYKWKSKIYKEQETQLLIKSILSFKEDIFDLIKKIHPYNIPELIVLPISTGEINYLSWIKKCLY